MESSIKLKPCPFCGAAAQVTRFGTDYIAECTCCDASCASGDTRERAAGMWNSRADASPCNTAALHDALKVANETADELLKWIWNHYQELNCMGGRLKRAIEGAIKKPPRNCDVGTPDEQNDRHCKFCDAMRHGMSGYHCEDAPRCVFCFAKWSQMPYEEGVAK